MSNAALPCLGRWSCSRWRTASVAVVAPFSARSFDRSGLRCGQYVVARTECNNGQAAAAVQRGVQWRAWSLWLRAVEQLARHTHDRHDLPDETLLWVKGIARLCDCAGPPGHWLDETEAILPSAVIRDACAGPSGLVCVRLGTGVRDGKAVDLDAFAELALPRIERPFARARAGPSGKL